jgi:hypothetical protein
MGNTTARRDLSIWRNDEVYEHPIRVRGPNLTGVAMRAQIRLAPDTPGAPLVNLALVDNGNAEGIRLVGAPALVDGLYENDVRIRINKSTRQALPYAGELGDAAVLSWVFAIGSVTRIVGEIRVLAHALDSDAAPMARSDGYGAAAAALPSGGTVLTIGADDVTALVIDGADLILPVAARVEVLADRSQVEAARSTDEANRAEAAADIAASGVASFFQTRGALNAALPANGKIARVWKDETQGNAYTEYRIENGVPVYKLRIVGNQRTTFLVFAASDSLDKGGSDIVLPGFADQNIINPALQSIRGGHAKRVLWRSGSYRPNDHIIIDDSHIEMKAENRGFWGRYIGANGTFTYPRSMSGQPGGATFFQSSPDKGVFRVGTNYYYGGERHNSIRFLDLCMDVAPGVVSTSTAIYDHAITDCAVIEGCFVRGFAQAFDVLWDAGKILDCNVQDTPDNPADPTQAAVKTWGFLTHVRGNLIFQCGGAGLRLGGIGTIATENIIGQNNGHQVLMTNRGQIFNNNQVTGITDGNYGLWSYYDIGDAFPPLTADGFLNKINDNMFRAVHLDTSPVPGMSGACKSAIRIGKDGAGFGGAVYTHQVFHNQFSNQTPRGTSPGYAVELTNGTGFCQVKDNMVDGNGWKHGQPGNDPQAFSFGNGPGNQTTPNMVVD